MMCTTLIREKKRWVFLSGKFANLIFLLWFRSLLVALPGSWQLSKVMDTFNLLCSSLGTALLHQRVSTLLMPIDWHILMDVLIVVSTFTKGEQMVPVLNKLDVRCAVYGNHDFGKLFFDICYLFRWTITTVNSDFTPNPDWPRFLKEAFSEKQHFVHSLDFGIDTLLERVEKTNFPWLMSNVIDNETGQPLADGKVSHIVDWCGRKIGLVRRASSTALDWLRHENFLFFFFSDWSSGKRMVGHSLYHQFRRSHLHRLCGVRQCFS